MLQTRFGIVSVPVIRSIYYLLSSESSTSLSFKMLNLMASFAMILLNISHAVLKRKRLCRNIFLHTTFFYLFIIYSFLNKHIALFHNYIHNTSRNINLFDNVTCKLVGNYFLSLCDNLILRIFLADCKCCLCLTVDLNSNLNC